MKISWKDTLHGVMLVNMKCQTLWKISINVCRLFESRDRNDTNPGYGLSLVDTLWNAGSYRQPLEQEGNPMT